MAFDSVDMDNARSVRELFVRFFGVPGITEPVENDYTIGTSVVKLGATTGPRIGLLACNTGSNNIAIGFSRGVTITAGILLQPAGTLRMVWWEDGELLFHSLYAIGAAAGQTLHLIENILTGA